MVRYLEATANHLYGWGSDWLHDDKPIYTKRQRKIKLSIAGCTTFLTIASLVADWYNFSYFALQTRNKCIEPDSSTTDNIFIVITVLCAVSTLLGFVELVAFVLQFRDTRNYVAPRTRSEALEETVSYLILVVENTFIPLTFVAGYFLGSCAAAAQIRSFPARIALVASGLSAIWRLVQSFAYCCHCKYDTCTFLMCQWIRYIRAFFIVSSLALILFLLSISLSLKTSVGIDDYVGQFDGVKQFGDTVNGVYLYQRFVAPYEIVKNEHEKDCTFFETRIQIARPDDITSIYKDTHYLKVNCADVSEFYDSLLHNKHRSLAETYDCYIIIGLQDSDFRAGRVINAGYELRDPDSSTCVSGHVELQLDYLYDVTESHKLDLDLLFTNRTIHALTRYLCDDQCPSTVPQFNGNTITLNCSAPYCVNDVNESRGTELGHMSSLLVPERELMSLYPCMSHVLIDRSFKLPLCSNHDVVMVENSTSRYTTCGDPYVKHVPRDVSRKWTIDEDAI